MLYSFGYTIPKLEPKSELAKSTSGPTMVVKPDTFNDDNNVVLFNNFVNPDTFKLLKKEFPLTFNDDMNVVLLFNILNPETFKDETVVVLLFNVVKPDTFKDDINVVLFNV